MRIRALGVLILALLAGCASAPPPRAATSLFHDELFAPPSQRIGADDIFALSAPMQRYLSQIAAEPGKGARQALIDALAQGQLRLEYDSARTRNASEAFEAKAGNCLSLVIMTAAFAKALGLEVRYNSAAVGDLWSRSGGLYFLNGHVNVTLGRREPGARTRYDTDELITVDFLPAREISGLRVRPLDEDSVVAMYMNNRAAEELVRARLDEAYWWARAAMRQAPSFFAAYNTLGVIYLRRGETDSAREVFARVLEWEPDNTRALANLALALGKLGRHAEAAAADAQLARVERLAPFHFFHRGLAAMEAADFAAARGLFREEIARAPDYHEFHFWLGLAELRLGNIAAARAELALALENSTTRRDHDLYAAKLAYLSAHHP